MYFSILRDQAYNSFLSDSFFLSRAITKLSCENSAAIIYFVNSKPSNFQDLSFFRKKNI